MYGHEFSRIESNVNIYGPYIYENNVCKIHYKHPFVF